MGTKTVGLREDVYERLKARKREDESFTDLVNRLIDETTADWRETFGTLPAGEVAELEQVVSASREATSRGVADRQNRAFEASDDVDGGDTASSDGS
jgi:predicted CopG family antitoxin